MIDVSFEGDVDTRSLSRAANFKEDCIQVKAGGTASLSNLTFDGKKVEADHPLVHTQEGGQLTLETGER